MGGGGKAAGCWHQKASLMEKLPRVITWRFDLKSPNHMWDLQITCGSTPCVQPLRDDLVMLAAQANFRQASRQTQNTLAPETIKHEPPPVSMQLVIPAGKACRAFRRYAAGSHEPIAQESTPDLGTREKLNTQAPNSVRVLRFWVLVNQTSLYGGSRCGTFCYLRGAAPGRSYPPKNNPLYGANPSTLERERARSHKNGETTSD